MWNNGTVWHRPYILAGHWYCNGRSLALQESDHSLTLINGNGVEAAVKIIGSGSILSVPNWSIEGEVSPDTNKNTFSNETTWMR